ncbi:quinol dehydrogenase ferredoxin subunit NapH [Campylobacter mucosalis]|uniref:quinol dehydrogenase ferredoxin subunit NapH n=1 Tax=Campylobacter mucosalis TaxID=202 RepID=UPI001470669F|nr:quinol dehydrogenase ferredoxin subunit NapH [Campylobacter mucosalis]
MKILLFRRLTQISILALFILSNHYGFKLLSGDLSASLLFGKFHLADPFALLQLFLAGATLSLSVILGAVCIALFYAILPPRAFCSWVCPVNLFTDIAAKLRAKFGFKDSSILRISRKTRYYFLALTLIFSAFLSLPVFESISFVGVVQRGIIFLDSFVIATIFVIIVFDIFVLERGVCGHICPLGAFYSLVSKFSPLRVSHNVSNCTKCIKCLRVCPEAQVLDMIGKRDGFVSSECVSCGRCIDVCEDNALKFSIINLKELK